MPQLAPFADFAALVSATRAQREASTVRPFRANTGGPVRACHSPCPAPSVASAIASATNVERAKRDIEAVRASYARFDRSISCDPRNLNGGRFTTAR